MHAPPGRAGALLAIALLSVHTASARPHLHVIRPPSSGSYFELADISADGRIVAGTVTSMKTSYTRAFRSVGRRQAKEIPMNLTVQSTSNALSEDGSVVLGDTYNAAGLYRAFGKQKSEGSLKRRAPLTSDLRPRCVRPDIVLRKHKTAIFGDDCQQDDTPPNL